MGDLIQLLRSDLAVELSRVDEREHVSTSEVLPYLKTCMESTQTRYEIYDQSRPLSKMEQAHVLCFTYNLEDESETNLHPELIRIHTMQEFMQIVNQAKEKDSGMAKHVYFLSIV